MMQEPALILFDGYCHLCCGSVQFILQRDAAGYFQFAPIEGHTARALFIKRADPQADSIVLYEGGNRYVRSTAALRIARKISGLWPLLYVFIVIPAPLRDWAYNQLAKNRYRWFGRSVTCWIPKPEWKNRFKN